MFTKSLSKDIQEIRSRKKFHRDGKSPQFVSYHLVLMREVQGSLSILHKAEVQSLDPGSRGISAIIAGWEKLSPAEANLNVIRAGSEDRLITIDRNVSISVFVGLGTVRQRRIHT